MEGKAPATREDFVYLRKKTRLERLDITPFCLAYLVISYLAMEVFEEVLYSKFLYLITFFIHGMVFLIGNWRISWKLYLHYSKTNDVDSCEEIYVKEYCKDGSIKQDIVKKEHDADADVTLFHFQKKKYVYDKDKRVFLRIKAFCEYPLSYFQDDLTSTDYKRAKNFDSNLLDFPLPDFGKIFKEQIMDPLNFFQLFSVALWFFDDNFFHPILTIVMVMVSIFSVSVDRMTTMMNLRNLILKPQHINVYRDGKWAKINSKDLVPGDIVSVVSSNKVREFESENTEEDNIDLLRKSIPFGEKIPKGMIMKMYSGGKNESKPVLPCDMVVLSGSCVVDESILTGESIPLIKDSILNVSEKEERLSIGTKHKSNLLFCGTEVLQTFSPSELPKNITSIPPDNGTVAFVLRTGFDTAKGKLSRSVIFNNENISLKQTEAFILLGMLLILSIASSLYVLNEGMKDENRDRNKLFLRCILIITSVVPPELPMITNISINTSLMYLRGKRIFCTEPARIPLAGRIDVCAFDKTGTLTTDRLEVLGVCVDTVQGNVIGSLTEAIAAKPQVAFVMGGCHTVVQHEGQLLGDPIEKLFFDGCAWKYNHSLKMSFNPKKSSQNVTIKFTHPFRSDLKRMSAVCKSEGFDHLDGNYALVKGAPEVIGELLRNKPENFDHTAFKLMKDGYRVLALACRKLESYNNLVIERDELEKNLDFVGLLVLNCPMKKDTPHYIKILKNANYHNIMITGDNMFTAAKTGQDLDFGPSKVNLFLKKTGDGKFEWFNIDDKPVATLKLEDIANLAKDHTLCLEGTEMAQVFEKDKALFTQLVLRTVIFARVSPDQKELIIKEIKESGLKVLMCGDGTNDVGALKKSDVGIALVGIKDEPDEEIVKAQRAEKQRQVQEAMKTRNFQLMKELSQPQKDEGTEFKSGDACIAAPFTNKYTNSLKCVVTVIRQGVCTMCTTIQTYRILTLQSLIYAYTMSTLHLENLKTSDAQNTCMGVFGAYFFFQLSNSKPIKKLSTIKPETTIFNLPFWMSILGQAAILLTYMQVSLHYSKEYSLEDDLKVTNEEEFKPTFRGSMMFLYELASMFCISIFNHEGEPFMQGLTSKGNHFKFIMLPLAIILLITLDISDMVNEVLQINLETKPEYANGNLFFCVLLTSMVALLYGWTRMIKYMRFKNTFGWL